MMCVAIGKSKKIYVEKRKETNDGRIRQKYAQSNRVSE